MDIKETVENVSVSWHTRIIWTLVFIFVAVVSYFVGLKWESYKSQARVDELQRAYVAEQDKLYVLSQDRASALKLVAISARSLDLLQQKNDIRIKEAGKSAYESKMAISDDDIGDAWRDFMSSVRERNNQRK